MKSKDLEDWGEPCMLEVKGLGKDPGSMIDPYLVQDKDDPTKWWCFFKQNGASYSWSTDLMDWTYEGSTEAGENVCVWVDRDIDRYLMMHSPENGMGILQSADLTEWSVFTEPEMLGQKDWKEWAGQRVTAGFVLDMRACAGIGKYLLFFHGQGRELGVRTTETLNAYCCIGIAWSDDLKTWEWPGKR